LAGPAPTDDDDEEEDDDADDDALDEDDYAYGTVSDDDLDLAQFVHSVLGGTARFLDDDGDELDEFSDDVFDEDDEEDGEEDDEGGNPRRHELLQDPDPQFAYEDRDDAETWTDNVAARTPARADIATQLGDPERLPEHLRTAAAVALSSPEGWRAFVIALVSMFLWPYVRPPIPLE
jgi:hypothetical protein